MELSEFVIHLTRVIFLLIAFITLFEYLAHRDETRLDIWLMFGSLAIVFGLQELTALTGLALPWISDLLAVALLAQPYLLVRLVSHFQPLSVRVRRLALAGMFLSWLVLLLMPDPLPIWAVLAVVAYFGWAELYATWAFIQGARLTGGVTHWRLLLAAIGSGLLGGAVIVAGTAGQIPALQPYTSAILQFVAAVSAVAYYFGFAPPRWLRHTWQLSELHRFLGASAGKPAAERASWMLAFLCETAMRAVGGRGALAASWEANEQRFTVRAATQSAWAMTNYAPGDGAMSAAWREGQPRLARQPHEMSADGRRLAETVGAASLMAVPVGTSERQWGLLVVFLRRSPLFADDDLHLLQLFAEQAALALEQYALLSEQRVLVEELRARTTQLEASNAELEAFSYSVSHDLRAPLRHIEGFTDLLRREGIAPEQRASHLERISAAAVRMGRLIDDLLTFSRMGRAELRRVPLRLDKLVDDVRSDLAPEMQGRDVQWRVEPLPEVLADPDLLRLALANLLSNAVKYTRGRQPAVIEVGCEAGASNEAVIFVRDNGVGFDMQYVDKLFGVFQRLHHADEFEGVGIGLANVRRIINRHGGRTWAVSRPGEGATFYFALPAVSREAPGWPSLSTLKGAPAELPEAA
jgi:signal transduction histidine kinase